MNQETTTVPISDTSDILIDFIPPMSESAARAKKHPIPDETSDDEDANGTGSRKRRQVSVGPDQVAPAVVEPTVGSSDSSPAPTPVPTSTSVAEASPPDSSDGTNDRTSKDYYFDSYSHHAIRKFDHLVRFLSSPSCR